MPNLKKPSPFAGRAGTGGGARGGWGIRAAFAGVLVILGIAIGWGLYGNTDFAVELHVGPGGQARRRRTGGVDFRRGSSSPSAD